MTAVQFRNPEVRLSEALTTTRLAIEGHRVMLRELLRLVGEQGLLVFCAILAMPFLLAVSLPFMSTALGADIDIVADLKESHVGGLVTAFPPDDKDCIRSGAKRNSGYNRLN